MKRLCMSQQCTFRFSGSLNDFLRAKERHTVITYRAIRLSSVKDAIEAIGIPHVEVFKILVNGGEKKHHYLLQNGDVAEVFPLDEIHSGAAPPTFILDVHLGRLCRLLRKLGFDCFYQNKLEDKEIVALAVKENRIVLTRDVGLLKHRILQHGYWLRSQLPVEQLMEVLKRFQLCLYIKSFSRCIACNGIIQPVNKNNVLQLLPEKTIRYYDDFYRCTICEKTYWKGSHYNNMLQWIEEIRSVACDRPSAADVIP